jgi:hypothetical protein
MQIIYNLLKRYCLRDKQGSSESIGLCWEGFGLRRESASPAALFMPMEQK